MPTNAMTDPHAGFLQKIIADPDNDALRLEYADWLEEQGEAARAEFILVQCELASVYMETNPAAYQNRDLSRCDALRRREREILNADDYAIRRRLIRGLPPRNGSFYTTPDGAGRVVRLGEWNEKTRCEYVFRRGFVEAVTCTAADWLAHADTILAAQPVREVTLTTANICNPRGFESCADILAFKWPGIKFNLPLAAARVPG